MTSIPLSVFFWNSPVMLRQQGSNITHGHIATHAPILCLIHPPQVVLIYKKYTGKKVVARNIPIYIFVGKT